jgi:hypothetical protein
MAIRVATVAEATFCQHEPGIDRVAHSRFAEVTVSIEATEGEVTRI